MKLSLTSLEVAMQKLTKVPINFPNKSACVPVAVAEKISSPLIIWYIKSQSGAI